MFFAMEMRKHWKKLVVGLIFTFVFLLFTTVYYALRIFPEVGMVLHSQCKNPIRNWDGKFLMFRVWKSSFSEYPPEFNVHSDLTEYERKLTISNSSDIQFKSNNKKVVIMWGSHHKTGTFLAQKIFSRICEKKNWCCMFHVTRDSIYAVKDSINNQNVDVLGHSQWIWYPEELGVENYRFVHFYRSPYKKVISGFRYHEEGSEHWNKYRLFYDLACKASIFESNESVSSSDGSFMNSTATKASLVSVSRMLRGDTNVGEVISTENVHGKMGKSFHHSIPHANPVSRKQVIEYCTAVHLCETCCRREHEYEEVLASHNYAAELALNSSHGKSNSIHKHLWQAVDAETIIHQSNSHPKHYLTRSGMEYKTLCHYLGKIDQSLQISLQKEPLDIALGIEASVDYFESLRMAKIYEHTKKDPKTLNVDLDYLMKNYDEAIRQILVHLQMGLSEVEIDDLVIDLRFFDVNASPIYRWSMSNPFYNHINKQK